MQSSGLQSQQVSQVRGFADQRPRKKESADDPSNRRISLIVEYTSKTPLEETGGPEVPGAEKSEAHHEGNTQTPSHEKR
jgi:chemotaxis protein MotB